MKRDREKGEWGIFAHAFVGMKPSQGHRPARADNFNPGISVCKIDSAVGLRMLPEENPGHPRPARPETEDFDLELMGEATDNTDPEVTISEE